MVLKRKLISIKYAKKGYAICLYLKKIIFFFQTAQDHYGLVPGNEVLSHGQSGAFFMSDLHAIGKLYAKYQFYKNIFPQTLIFSVQHSDQ